MITRYALLYHACVEYSNDTLFDKDENSIDNIPTSTAAKPKLVKDSAVQEFLKGIVRVLTGSMAQAQLIFQEPTFVVITGASQGLGRSIAIELAAELTEGSVLVITARNKDGLKETARMAKLERRDRIVVGDVQIITMTSDLSKSEASCM